uniref:ARVCF delta catenin family member n=1 Tax=Capra hircus TaxID=9925 RepID=A0A8C2S5X9_CAPHI
MEDCSVRSAATILASVREQEARFELLTRALEQERRHVALQLERAQQPGTGGGQSLPMAWQQLVLQEQSPGSQASLATMPEAPEVLEETVTVEEDPGTPTSHVSIVTSEDGTTRRTETKVRGASPPLDGPGDTNSGRLSELGPDPCPCTGVPRTQAPALPFPPAPLVLSLRSPSPSASGNMPTGETLAQPQPFTWKGVGHLPPGLVAPHVVLPARLCAGGARGPHGRWDPIIVFHRNIQLGVGGLPGGRSKQLPRSGDNLPDSQCDCLGARPQPRGDGHARARSPRAYEDVADDGGELMEERPPFPAAAARGSLSGPSGEEGRTEPAVSPGALMVPAGTLWNLSSYEPLKMVIIDHGLQTLTHEVIVPSSGWEPEPNEDSKPRDAEWTTVFKNTSGCLRNVSSDGAEARRRLRECEGLVDALLHALQSAVGRKDTDNKSVENCVCIVRNLSYHVHKEVPGAERYQEAEPGPPGGSGSAQRRSREDAGCFGGKKAKEEWFHQGKRDGEMDQNSDTLDLPKRTEAAKGFELLYQPEVVRLYLSLLTERSYAMAELVRNVRSAQAPTRPGARLEEDTVVAVLNTIHEIVSDSLDNARSLLQARGVPALVALGASSQSVREAKAASHVLQTVWSYKELRSTLQKDGWSKARFQSAAANARGPKAAPSPGGLDDSTLPLVEKSLDGEKPGGQDMIPMEALGPDGYSTMDRRERRARGSDPAGEASEKEPLKPDPSRKAPPPGPSRPAVRLVDAVGDARPPPVDSWV